MKDLSLSQFLKVLPPVFRFDQVLTFYSLHFTADPTLFLMGDQGKTNFLYIISKSSLKDSRY